MVQPQSPQDRDARQTLGEQGYRRGYQQSAAFVIRLLEHGATLNDLRRWERLLWNWRHDSILEKWIAYVEQHHSIKPSKPIYDNPETRLAKDT